ncbi:Crp/Fnr family transcriptional regulator [Micromonospora sp. DSM 115977]|uniref:Crp/Fnr family transcriptional regulator n=1 Tax=Micromonospora reichwaldensis TaxID=3075516 RepID=A0ABU2WUF9_9ACTN|nr:MULTISPECIES: Crp/Fnr family transcriptional regulator [unclassified Micromonospora]MDT0529163.1 Crp/Fnr family transcriptional regulator [Micromonospora sp. DSM 115977]WSF99745.1 Crp/Fnr family transcriptional regulator [Micromonospora sp. NBC_01740]
MRGHLGSGLVAHLPQDEWLRVQDTGIPVRFEPRDVLLRQGDTTQHVHVVLAGCVKIVRSESDGSCAILTLRAAGDVVGDLAAVDLQPRSATVTALTTTVTRLLTGPQFRRFLTRPAFAVGFATYTVSRLRASDAQRAALAVLPVRERLVRALIQLDRESRHADGGPAIRLSQAELAELVGASRNAVVAELTALREAGILVTGRREVTILDLAALSDRSHGFRPELGRESPVTG